MADYIITFNIDPDPTDEQISEHVKFIAEQIDRGFTAGDLPEDSGGT